MSENINKLYKYSGKDYNQHQYKYILEAAMVFNPAGLTNNIPISPVLYVSGKTQLQENLSVNSLKFWIKKKIDVRILGTAKLNLKATRKGSILWSSI